MVSEIHANSAFFIGYISMMQYTQPTNSSMASLTPLSLPWVVSLSQHNCFLPIPNSSLGRTLQIRIAFIHGEHAEQRRDKTSCCGIHRVYLG